MASDRERLDWLLKRVIPYEDGALIFDPIPQFSVADLGQRRQAIDAAMKSAKKPTKKEARP